MYKAIVVTIVFFVGISMQSTAFGQDRAGSDDNQIQTWIAQLDSDTFDQREQATRQLIDAGVSAIGDVAEAAASDSFEVSWRAGNILQQIGLNGDEATLKSVVAVMQKLESSGVKSLGKSREELFARWQQVRHDRAANKIRQLGGIVQEMPGGWAMGGFGGGFLVDLDDAMPVFEIVEDIAIMEDEIEVFGAPVDEVELPTIEEEVKALDVDVSPVEEKVEALKVEIPSIEERVKALDLEGADTDPDALEPIKTRVERTIIDARARSIEKALRDDDDTSSLPKDDETSEPVAADKPPKIEPLEVRRLEDAIEDLEREAAIAVPVDAIDIDVDFDFVPPMFFGDAIWVDPANVGQTTRSIALGAHWKGTAEDYQLLTQLDKAVTLSLDHVKLPDQAISHIGNMPHLRQLSLTKCAYNRELLIRFKRSNPKVNIQSHGDTLLGVTGNAHARGFHVTRVVPGSGAEKAGVRNGDVITAADGMTLKSLDELMIIVGPKKVDEKLPLSLLRDGRAVETVAILSSRDKVDFNSLPQLEESFDPVSEEELAPLIDPPSKKDQ